MTIREEIEDRECNYLSPFAMKSRYSRGREYLEAKCNIRTDFQRDRDRIIHSKSFRRLKHKTQVFLSYAGDHYRTRLTHTLEVSQIARTISVALNLNETLTEAIALGHDLGHTPFGHAGEKVISEILGVPFKHNLQSVKVVNLLEKNGKGLNLTFEVIDGIKKHSKGRGPILKNPCSLVTLEGQVVRIADIIAYINHDIDDAVRAGIIKVKELPVQVTNIIGETHNERISSLVTNVISTTLLNKYQSISMEDEFIRVIEIMRDFLFQNVYESDIIRKEMEKAHKVLHKLFGYFKTGKEKIPDMYHIVNSREDVAICDYIAGMTDNFAEQLYNEVV